MTPPTRGVTVKGTGKGATTAGVEGNKPLVCGVEPKGVGGNGKRDEGVPFMF